MRILIADAFPQTHADALREAGHDIDHQPGLTSDDLGDHLAGADVLIVRSTKVTADAIAAADDLSLIVRAGAGTNTIDVAAAADRAIYVCNVPGRNAIAVAELTMGLLLSLDRSIADATADLRAGRWDKKRYSTADGIHGKTMAIVGYGAIGQHVASRAIAFGMQVVVEDRPGRDEETLAEMEELGIDLAIDREALLADADVVSLHVPLNDATEGLVDADFLEQMKDGAWLLNTSRGEVVDSSALLAALDDRGMRAGLDVFDDEPGSSTGEFTHPLAQHPSVVGTHHIGASTEQAQLAIADGVLELVGQHVAGRLDGAVNLVSEPRGACTLVVRHRNVVGVLSSVLQRLRQDGINVEQMTNRVFAGGGAAVATVQLSEVASDATQAELAALDTVLGVQVRGADEAAT